MGRDRNQALAKSVIAAALLIHACAAGLICLWAAQRSCVLMGWDDFRADIIDTLAMTITPFAGILSAKMDITLPVKPCLAIRVMRV